ncbi:MAG TPA: methyltransferase domain-containing protein [Spongiibacteraceae bacterium]|nr:methyltransferase domain-containing protein [Spongiibacteraceae bacterium]
MLDLIRNLKARWRAGANTELPIAVPVVPAEQTSSIDPRMCGLEDAVKSGWFLQESDELIKGFQIRAADVFLDFGCGAGGATAFAAQRGAHVIFSDIERAKVDALAQRLQSSAARCIQPLVGDDRLALEDACATKIVCMEVLEHVEAPEKIMAELVRVGKSGAQYLLTVPAPESEHLQRSFAPPAYFDKPNHITVFSNEQFARLVEGAGLVIERRDQWGFYWVMWMSLYWACEKAAGNQQTGAVHDQLTPPYHPLLNAWADLWHQFINLPGGVEAKHALDGVLPKTQVIIARKR